MIVRKDRRTPSSLLDEIGGYPIQTKYNYLGIIIDDCLKFDISNQKKDEKNKKLLKL